MNGRDYKAVCLLSDHSMELTAPSQWEAESLLQEQGWTKTYAGWVCRAHRDTRRDRPDTWTGTPRYFLLDDRHIGCVTDLSVNTWFNQRVLRVGYQIAPLEHPAARPNAEWRQLLAGKDFWNLVARDDVGTRYEVQGGASGYLALEWPVFDSEVDFEPAVSPVARSLEVIFTNEHHPKEPVYTLRADVATIGWHS